MLVVDASVIAPAVADDGPDGEACRARIRGQSLAAPDLLRVETVSVIRCQLANNALTATQANNAIEGLLNLPIVVYPTAALLRRAWELRDNATAYDACYVALAEALGCPLATADQRLADAPGAHCSSTSCRARPLARRTNTHHRRSVTPPDVTRRRRGGPTSHRVVPSPREPDAPSP